MEFTNSQKGALLRACNDRSSLLRELIKKEASVDYGDIDMNAITTYTAEYNDLQSAMTQLAMNGAVMQ